MYCLDNAKSDIDYLSIYIKSNYENNSYLWEHHQLQFKENNIDYNYTDIQTFIRNILTGDATINFEVLYSSNIKDSSLNWLYKYRKRIVNYNIIKSYLGMAKRDLKNWKRITKNGNFYNEESNKKLSHFFRGVISASLLMNNKFSLDFTTSYSLNNYNDYDVLYNSKSGSLLEIEKKIMEYEAYMYELREELNDRLNDGEINKIGEVNMLSELDMDLKRYIKLENDKIFLNSEFGEDNDIKLGNTLYEALADGVTYETKQTK